MGVLVKSVVGKIVVLEVSASVVVAVVVVVVVGVVAVLGPVIPTVASSARSPPLLVFHEGELLVSVVVLVGRSIPSSLVIVLLRRGRSR